MSKNVKFIPWVGSEYAQGETFARFECFKKSVISEFFIQHFSF